MSSIDIGDGFRARPYGDGFIIDHADGGCAPADLATVAAVREIERLRAAIAAPPGWVLVTERMPKSGATVLACYRNSAGNLRRIRAEWVAAKTQESGEESDIGVYDEETDTTYDPEGWYEQIDNWDDEFSAIGVHQGEVTYWMPLPAAPGAPDASQSHPQR